jgi:hypothetical protein
MKEIQLSQGKLAQVDDEDFEYLLQWRWSYLKGARTGYAVRTVKDEEGKKHNILMHRLLMSTPKGMECDHRDGNGLNNQSTNLRNCTSTENKRNVSKHKGVSSIYKGVWYDKKLNRWQVRVSRLDVGRFKEEHHAALAYDLWATDMYGEFARTNFKRVGGSC